jgi:hypothetical protein
MRRSRSPASSLCSASGRDSLDWEGWAFKAKLRLRSGTPCWGLELFTVQKGSVFARDGYLHQSQKKNRRERYDLPSGRCVRRWEAPATQSLRLS